MFDLLPTAEHLAKALRAGLTAVLAATERVIPFDEARAQAWLETSATPAAGAESGPSAGDATPLATPTPAEAGRDWAALIAEVLQFHSPVLCSGTRELFNCGVHPGYYEGWAAWRAHIAPLIAERLKAAQLNAAHCEHCQQPIELEVGYAELDGRSRERVGVFLHRATGNHECAPVRGTARTYAHPK